MSLNLFVDAWVQCRHCDRGTPVKVILESEEGEELMNGLISPNVCISSASYDDLKRRGWAVASKLREYEAFFVYCPDHHPNKEGENKGFYVL